MSTSATMPSYVGVDISKSRLDVHVRPAGIAFSVTRDPGGLADLAKRLLSLEPILIVLEATGGFEIMVTARLPVPACHLPSSTRASCVISLARAASSRKPTPWMRRRSRCSRSVSSHRRGSFPMSRREVWPTWSLADGR